MSIDNFENISRVTGTTEDFDNARVEAFARLSERRDIARGGTGASGSGVDWLPAITLVAADATPPRQLSPEERAQELERKNPDHPGQEYLVRRASLRAWQTPAQWRLEQSEIEATASLVAQNLRNSNGMLDPRQESRLRALLQSRLVGATSEGSYDQQLMRRIEDATNRKLAGSGYRMIFDNGAMGGAPTLTFHRDYTGHNEGGHYPAVQRFFTIGIPKR